jgi:hypothetical protein
VYRLFLVILVLAALVTWGEFAARIVWPAAWVSPWSHTAGWVAARLTVEGRGDLIYAGGRAFQEESARLGAVPDTFAANAPTAILPYLPLAGLSVDAARTAWIVFTLACFLAAWVLLLRALRLPLVAALAASAAVPLFQPLRNNVATGEVYALAFALIVAGGLLASRAAPPEGAPESRGGFARQIGAGGAFALLGVVRSFYGLGQLFTPAARRQWVIVATALGLYGAAALLTLAWLGTEAWGRAIGLSLAWRELPETAVTAYQSLNNFLTHLLRYHPTLNPGPVADLPRLVGPLWWGLALGMLAASARVVWRYRTTSGSTAQGLLPYALATPLALLLAPISEDYHYTQTLFPLLVAGAALWELRPRRAPRAVGNQAINVVPWAVLAAAIILLAPPWRFYNVPGAEGWHALLYYPRFYGNLLLWGLVLWLVVRIARNQRQDAKTPRRQDAKVMKL